MCVRVCVRVVTCFIAFLLFSFKMATLEEDVGQGSPSPNSVDYSSRDRNTVTEGKHTHSLFYSFPLSVIASFTI